MRLIDADAINDFHIDYSSYKEGPDEEDVTAWLDEQPTIEAEPVRHGEWLPYPSDQYRKCSLCGIEYAKFAVLLKYKYCPNCGAKMDGGEKE